MGFVLSLNGDATDEDTLRVPEIVDQFYAQLREVGALRTVGTLTLNHSGGSHSVSLDAEHPAANAFVDMPKPLPAEQRAAAAEAAPEVPAVSSGDDSVAYPAPEAPTTPQEPSAAPEVQSPAAPAPSAPEAPQGGAAQA